MTLSAALLGTGACSAISATVACRRAERSLERAARKPDGSEATYQLTLAQAYLDKAREEASHAEYGAARSLAAAATLASHRATGRGPRE